MPAVRKGHPRIFFNSETWPAVKAAAYPGLALFPNFIWWNWIQNEKASLQFGSGDTRHGLNQLSIGNLPEHLVQYAHFFREANPDAARLAATLRRMVPPRNLAQTWPMYPFLLAGADNVQPFALSELAALSPRARHFESTGQFFLSLRTEATTARTAAVSASPAQRQEA